MGRRLRAAGFGAVMLFLFLLLAPTGAFTTQGPTLYLPLLAAGTDEVPEEPLWLQEVNRYRSNAGVARLTERVAWSSGAGAHARYMVRNDEITHDQEPGNPWYTAEGDEAAGASNVYVSSNVAAPDTDAIDYWMTAPFHGVAILDPALTETGFGSHREEDGGWQMGAALDVSRGRSTVPEGTDYPILWPAPDESVTLLAHDGVEYPDPLASCAGYSLPSGLPILIQTGPGSGTPEVSASRLLGDGQPLEHCLFTEETYRHPEPAAQAIGRLILDSRDAVVLIPRLPLAPGSRYEVALTIDGVAIEWTFAVPSARSQTRGALLW